MTSHLPEAPATISGSRKRPVDDLATCRVKSSSAAWALLAPSSQSGQATLDASSQPRSGSFRLSCPDPHTNEPAPLLPSSASSSAVSGSEPADEPITNADKLEEIELLAEAQRRDRGARRIGRNLLNHRLGGGASAFPPRASPPNPGRSSAANLGPRTPFPSRGWAWATRWAEPLRRRAARSDLRVADCVAAPASPPATST
jgi:hypothetical protein